MMEGTGTSRDRKIFLGVSALIVLVVIVAAREVLLPFVLALVVAYVLTPAVRRVERRRVPRWIAILVVYAITFGAIALSIQQIVPRLVAEGQQLASEWPKLTRVFREEWVPKIDAKLAAWSGQPIAIETPAPLVPPAAIPAPTLPPPTIAAPPPPPSPDDKPPPFRLVKRPDGSYDVRVGEGVQFRQHGEGVWQIEQTEERHRPRGISTSAWVRDGYDKAAAYLKANSFAVVKFGRDVVAAITRGIFVTSITLMLAAYIILTHEKILAFFRDLVPPQSRDAFDRFLRRLDRGLAGVVRGQLMICLVNGVLSAIGFALFGLKYWPILSVVAGIMSLIPIFGSILSSVPAVLIGFTQSPATAIGVLAWIIGIHQLEANFLNPKIIGDSAKIHPVLVVFSLIVGEHFFQLTGALFAVPCMSIAQTIFLHFRESTMGLRDPMASIPPTVPPSRLAFKTPTPPVRADETASSTKSVEPREASTKL